MTDEEVLDEARVDGFELIERMSAGQWAVGWAREADDRWPCFFGERQALNWMRRLNRGREFVWIRAGPVCSANRWLRLILRPPGSA